MHSMYSLRLCVPQVLFFLATLVNSCYIQGQDSGYCTSTAKIETTLPFCGKYVKLYPSACLPKEYDYYPNMTALSKDRWVQRQAENTIARRSQVERDNGANGGLLPYDGPQGKLLVHFYKNGDCEDAYKRYLCYLNFPRCDDAQNSLLMCVTSCESFFKACRYPHSSNDNLTMWRCGSAEYNGGYAPEYPTSIVLSLPVYSRGYFPGQPFAPYAPGACTPGVPGGATSVVLGTIALATATLLSMCAAFIII